MHILNTHQLFLKIMSEKLHDPYRPNTKELEEFKSLSRAIDTDKKISRCRISRKNIESVFSALPSEPQISLSLTESRLQLGSICERHPNNQDAALSEIYGRRFTKGAYPSLSKISISERIFDHGLKNLYLTIALLERSYALSTKGYPALDFSDWLFNRFYVQFKNFTENRAERALTFVNVQVRQHHRSRNLFSFLIRCFRNSAQELGTALVMECVQPRLSIYLHRNGWVRLKDDPKCNTWLDPETLPNGSYIEQRMFELWGEK